MKIKTLPVYNGDSILISFDSKEGVKNILIDSGIGRSHLTIVNELKKIEALGQTIELLVITHIDDDHIGGILKLFSNNVSQKSLIKKIWFNSGTIISEFFKTGDKEERSIRIVSNDQPNISIKQGNTLEKNITELGVWNRTVVYNGLEPINFYGADIIILSPSISNLDNLNQIWEVEADKSENISASKLDYKQTISELSTQELNNEDTTAPNGSSIAFLLEYNKLRYLYLADSHPSTIEDSLRSLGYSEENPVELSVVKVSHHGSSRNISDSLIKIWKCKKYIISTNGSKHGLPNKLCLSKLITSSEPGVELYFNYSIVKEKNIFSSEDYKEHDFKCSDLSDRSFDYEILFQE
jgi:beta-lactamase superfamily II metal-dependent hydrolase